jgi:hypothetical protein
LELDLLSQNDEGGVIGLIELSLLLTPTFPIPLPLFFDFYISYRVKLNLILNLSCISQENPCVMRIFSKN